MAKKAIQLHLIGVQGSAYGGDLLKTRKGRSGPRPLATKSTMHLVLRSSQAVGPLSFRKPDHMKKIKEILSKFSGKYWIKILSIAIVGNHIHLQIQLFRRETYKPFIRAITSAIAMAVTGVSRWTKAGGLKAIKFWDSRPFTRVLKSFREKLNLKDYIEINQLEGFGYSRHEAREIIIEWKEQRGPPVDWRLVEG